MPPPEGPKEACVHGGWRPRRLCSMQNVQHASLPSNISATCVGAALHSPAPKDSHQSGQGAPIARRSFPGYKAMLPFTKSQVPHMCDSAAELLGRAWPLVHITVRYHIKLHARRVTVPPHYSHILLLQCIARCTCTHVISTSAASYYTMVYKYSGR